MKNLLLLLYLFCVSKNIQALDKIIKDSVIQFGNGIYKNKWHLLTFAVFNFGVYGFLKKTKCGQNIEKNCKKEESLFMLMQKHRVKTCAVLTILGLGILYCNEQLYNAHKPDFSKLFATICNPSLSIDYNECFEGVQLLLFAFINDSLLSYIDELILLLLSISKANDDNKEGDKNLENYNNFKQSAKTFINKYFPWQLMIIIHAGFWSFIMVCMAKKNPVSFYTLYFLLKIEEVLKFPDAYVGNFYYEKNPYVKENEEEEYPKYNNNKKQKNDISLEEPYFYNG